MLRSRPFVRTEHHPFKVCSNFNCPFCVRSVAAFKVKPLIGKERFFGSSPAPFVGRFGYPFVNVGILSPPEVREDAWLFDAPGFWASNNFQIPEIVGYRSALVNSHLKAHVKGSGRILEIGREVGMASAPVDVEVLLKSRPFFRFSPDSVAAPVGPSGVVKHAKITSNPKIPQKVDKVYSDNGLKASDAFSYLYRSGFDEAFLSRILSVGTVGLKPDRRLVPTRWSITATDDILGKHLISAVKDFQSVNDFLFYFGGYLGNYFAVMMLPDVWGYELFETLAGSSSFTTDYEPYSGRTAYVEETAGGYYASRLPVLEKLRSLGRQACVLVVRVITSDYTVPLGVWVVRQAVRAALDSSPVSFASLEAMIAYAEAHVKRRFGHDIRFVFSRSRLLAGFKGQKKLSAFFGV